MTSKLVVNEIAADTGISTITVGDNMSGVTFKTGTSNLHNVGIEIAGINVLGADTPIGVGATIYNSGDVLVGGAVTATAFSGSGTNLTALNATNLGSGTVPTARLGSGTANNSVFLRGDSSWQTVTSTTINNNANDRIITGSGTANTLEAETSLEWDGTDTLKVVHGSSYPDFRVEHSAGGGTFESFRCGNGPFRIKNTTQSFYSAADELAIGSGSGDRGLTIYSGSSDSGVIAFADGTSDPAYRMGQIIYGHNDNSMSFRTNGNTERVRIDSSGVLRVGNTATQSTSSNSKRIALGAKGSIQGWVSGQLNGHIQMIDNYYWDGANNKAIEADHCAYLSLRSGTLRFGSTNSTQTAGQNVSGGINERLRIQADGKVGINVTDPDSTLEINKGSEGRYLRIGGDNASNGRSLTFTSSTGNTGSNGALHTISATSGNGVIVLDTAGSERLRITADGQIKKQQGANRTSLNTYNSNADSFWLDHYQFQDAGEYRRYTDIVSKGDASWGSHIRVFGNDDSSGNAIERLHMNHKGYVYPTPGGGSIMGVWKYRQRNQSQNYEHIIRGPYGNTIATDMDGNAFFYIEVAVVGTGTGDAWCEYHCDWNSSESGATLSHVRGNNSGSSNRPYMVLNSNQPYWKMDHGGSYDLDIKVQMMGGKVEVTYTGHGSYTSNP